jgi:hypothetical protein
MVSRRGGLPGAAFRSMIRRWITARRKTQHNAARAITARAWRSSANRTMSAATAVADRVVRRHENRVRSAALSGGIDDHIYQGEQGAHRDDEREQGGKT